MGWVGTEVGEAAEERSICLTLHMQHSQRFLSDRTAMRMTMPLTTD